MKKWYLYHIRFFNEDETFEKIGITKKSPQERFGKEHYLNYEIEILNLERLPQKECKEKEKRLLQFYKELSYIPLNEEFSGKTECFQPYFISLQKNPMDETKEIPEELPEETPKENKYKELKNSDLKPLREKIWLKNNKKCPVLDKEVPFEKTVVDHAHKRKDEDYAPDKGVVREVLDFRCNSILGKLENSLKRTGLMYEEDFHIGDFLRNAALYFEKGAYIDEEGYMLVHPKEVPPPKILTKRSYNKLKKLYINSNKKAKFPEYPKSGKITKKLNELYKEFNLEPEFYSG